MKINSLCALALVFVCVSFTGCQSTSNSDTGTQASESSSEAATGQIVLNGSSITAGSGVSVDGTIATVTAGGTYEISGSLDDGQIVVDANSKVTLILNNADITCTTSSPIYVKAASQVVINLAEGSENTISDGSTYELADAATD